MTTATTTSRLRRHYDEPMRNPDAIVTFSGIYLHCAATTKTINAFHIFHSIPLHIFPPTFCCIHFNIMIYYHYQLAKLNLRDAMGVWDVLRATVLDLIPFSILTYFYKRDTIYTEYSICFCLVHTAWSHSNFGAVMKHVVYYFIFVRFSIFTLVNDEQIIRV